MLDKLALQLRDSDFPLQFRDRSLLFSAHCTERMGLLVMAQIPRSKPVGRGCPAARLDLPLHGVWGLWEEPHSAGQGEGGGRKGRHRAAESLE